MNETESTQIDLKNHYDSLAFPLHSMLVEKNWKAVRQIVNEDIKRERLFFVSSLGLTIFQENGSSDDSSKINRKTKGGSILTYPLHLACSARISAPPDIIALIIKANPSKCNVHDTYGFLPIHYIVDQAHRWNHNGIIDVIEDMLEKFPNIAKVCSKKEGDLPLHVFCKSIALNLITSANKSQLQRILRVLLKSYPEGARCFDESSGSLPLHILCSRLVKEENGTLSRLVRSLLLAYPDSAMLFNRQGRLALHCAMMQRNPDRETIETLIACRPEAVKVRDKKYGFTPLMVACATEEVRLTSVRTRESIVHSMLTACQESVKIRDQNEITPLMKACQSNASEVIICALLEAYPEAARIAHKENNRLPLHYACHNKKVSDHVIDQLLFYYKNGTQQEETKHGMLPIHIGCNAGAPETIIRKLLSAHRISARMLDNYGNIPLHYATSQNQPQTGAIVALLLAFPCSASIKNATGKCAIELAKESAPGDSNILNILSAPPDRWNRPQIVTEYLQPSALFSNKNDNLGKEAISTPGFFGSKEPKCIVCMEASVSCVIVPCGHACLCDECSSPSKISSLNDKCPLCRQDFESVVRVYGRIVRDD